MATPHRRAAGSGHGSWLTLIAALSTAAAPGTRPAAAVAADLRAVDHDLATALPPAIAYDPAKRDVAAPRVLPLLRRQRALLAESAAAAPADDDAVRQATNEAVLFLFHDPDTVDHCTRGMPYLSEQFDDADGVQLYASALGTDPAAAADESGCHSVGDLLSRHPHDGQLTAIAYALSQRTHDIGAQDELERAALSAPNPTAARLAAWDRAHNRRTIARLKLEARVGQPMVIAGTTVDGKPFTTADWQGKVVVVDFWATWCKPCCDELPALKAVYDKGHARGLEIVGVSNDIAADRLTVYTTSHGYPWPQLFDRRAAGHDWHPITTGYDIPAIPRLFVIDRRGTCRSVTADGANVGPLVDTLLAD